ncbi:MAG: hypothetical protein J0M24_25415 [Verrucomicrobia bacterium]|nr:hypothetical protein [Verrucomicrobiota bacterium]
MKTQGSIAIASLFISVAGLQARDIEKGKPAAPPNVKSVAGSYYCGDGLGYNVTLTLKENGTYSAEWHGCLGKYGDASGSWKLSDKQIALIPKTERDMMKGHLKTLDVLEYKGGWVFVRADDRDFYDKHGVSRYSCFQKRDQQ